MLVYQLVFLWQVYNVGTLYSGMFLYIFLLIFKSYIVLQDPNETETFLPIFEHFWEQSAVKKLRL